MFSSPFFGKYINEIVSDLQRGLCIEYQNGICLSYVSIFSLFKNRKVLLWITLVLTYLRTSHLPYKSSTVHVIFRRSHPILKLIKQKMSKILQVNVPIFFSFRRNPKKDQMMVKKQVFEKSSYQKKSFIKSIQNFAYWGTFFQKGGFYSFIKSLLLKGAKSLG